MTVPKNIRDSISGISVLDSTSLIEELDKALSQTYEDKSCDPGEQIRGLSIKELCKTRTDEQKRSDLQRELGKLNDIVASSTPSDNTKCVQECLDEVTTINRSFKERVDAAMKLSEEIPDREMILYAWSVQLHFHFNIVYFRLRRSSAENLKKKSKEAIDAIITLLDAIAQTDPRATYEVGRIRELLSAYSLLLKDVEETTDSNFTIQKSLASILSEARRNTNMFVGRSVIRTGEAKSYDVKLTDDLARASIINRTLPWQDYLDTLSNRISSLDFSSMEVDRLVNFTKESRQLQVTVRRERLPSRYSVTLSKQRRLGKSYAETLMGSSKDDLDGNDNPTKKVYDSFKSVLDSLYVSLISVVDAYEGSDTDNLTDELIGQMGSLACCGKPVEVPEDTLSFGGIKDSVPDMEWRDFDINNRPTVTDIDYWKRYANFLTLLSLIPKYWTVGLLVPSPNGVVRVKLPIIWKPLFVIDSPLGIFVTFITINGMVISPYIWQFGFPDNVTKHLQLFRGSNEEIGTSNSSLAGILIVNNINVDVPLTKTLQFGQDDLPTIKRMGLNNPAWFSYLDKWLVTAKPYMGFP